MVEEGKSDSIDKDSYEFVLETQLKSFSHVQNQAQRILRVLLASVAVVVAFTRSSLYQSLYQILTNLEIPEPTVEVAGGSITHSGSFYRQIGQFNLVIGLLLIGISILLVADSAIQSFRVLREKPIQPTQERKDSGFSFAMKMESIPKGMYQKWASENGEKLERMNRRLQGSFARVLEAGFVFLISVTILGSVYSGKGNVLALIDWLLVAIGITSIGVFVYKLAMAGLTPDGHWVDELKKEINYWAEGQIRSTPSAMAAYPIIMVYMLVFILALVSGIIWFMAVWYPELAGI